MSAEPGIVDANVLVYAFYTDAEHHPASRQLLERGHESGAGLRITSQVLAEFFSIVTNRKRVTLARSPADAISAIEAIVALPGMTVCQCRSRQFLVGWNSCGKSQSRAE